MKSTGYNSGDLALKLEIAISQEDIKTDNPGIVSFLIPVLMTESYKGVKHVNNYNVSNKNKVGTPSVSNVTIDNTIQLEVPKEYTDNCGVNILPKGTKFIVAFIEGDINEIRIIGRYDSIINSKKYNLSTSIRNNLGFGITLKNGKISINKNDLDYVNTNQVIRILEQVGTGELGYVLPKADEKTLGVVKIGEGLKSELDGTLNLLPANKKRLGGVRQGINVKVEDDGTLTVTPATIEIPGAVKPGRGLSIEKDGTLNAEIYSITSDEILSIIQNVTDKNKI